MTQFHAEIDAELKRRDIPPLNNIKRKSRWRQAIERHTLELSLIGIGLAMLAVSAMAKQKPMPDVIKEAWDAVIQQEIADRKAAKRYSQKDRAAMNALVKKATR